MKVVSSENNWRPINQFEVETVIKYAHQECGYHKVGSWFFIAFIVAVFSTLAIPISIYNSWSALSFTSVMLAFILIISIPIYLIVQENRRLKMLMDGKVRCMSVTVSGKRIGSLGTGAGGLYLVGINRPETSKLTRGKTVREYDVSKKTYDATQVKGKGLLIRFDTGSEEKSWLRYRFLPLVN